MDLNNDGYIDYLEFCKGFERDPTEQNMKNLFRLFNVNFETGPDKFGFDDFLTGVCVCVCVT